MNEKYIANIESQAEWLRGCAVISREAVAHLANDVTALVVALREANAALAAAEASEDEPLDAIAKLCGCAQWEYPGQVVRDVEAVVAEHDQLRARAEKAEAERDKLARLREIRGLTLALNSDEAPLSDIAEAVMHITVGGHAAKIEEGGGTIMLAILTKHADGTGRVGATFSFDFLKDVSKLAAECAIRREETARLRTLVQAVASGRADSLWWEDNETGLYNMPDALLHALNACVEEVRKWEK